MIKDIKSRSAGADTVAIDEALLAGDGAPGKKCMDRTCEYRDDVEDTDAAN